MGLRKVAYVGVEGARVVGGGRAMESLAFGIGPRLEVLRFYKIAG